MRYAFGDVVIISFPFTNQSTVKVRPAVVVSSAAYQRERPDLILMAITSQVKPFTAGEAVVKNWKGSGLFKPSIFKPLLATVEAGLVLKHLGHLEEPDEESVRRILALILG